MTHRSGLQALATRLPWCCCAHPNCLCPDTASACCRSILNRDEHQSLKTRSPRLLITGISPTKRYMRSEFKRLTRPAPVTKLLTQTSERRNCPLGGLSCARNAHSPAPMQDTASHACVHSSDSPSPGPCMQCNLPPGAMHGTLCHSHPIQTGGWQVGLGHQDWPEAPSNKGQGTESEAHTCWAGVGSHMWGAAGRTRCHHPPPSISSVHAALAGYKLPPTSSTSPAADQHSRAHQSTAHIN